jgi:hypothetical protein
MEGVACDAATRIADQVDVTACMALLARQIRFGTNDREGPTIDKRGDIKIVIGLLDLLCRLVAEGAFTVAVNPTRAAADGAPVAPGMATDGTQRAFPVRNLSTSQKPVVVGFLAL